MLVGEKVKGSLSGYSEGTCKGERRREEMRLSGEGKRSTCRGGREGKLGVIGRREYSLQGPRGR